MTLVVRLSLFRYGMGSCIRCSVMQVSQEQIVAKIAKKLSLYR